MTRRPPPRAPDVVDASRGKAEPQAPRARFKVTGQGDHRDEAPVLAADDLVAELVDAVTAGRGARLRGRARLQLHARYLGRHPGLTGRRAGAAARETVHDGSVRDVHER